jgi:hypothetical protein
MNDDPVGMRRQKSAAMSQPSGMSGPVVLKHVEPLTEPRKNARPPAWRSLVAPDCLQELSARLPAGCDLLARPVPNDRAGSWGGWFLSVQWGSAGCLGDWPQ